MTADIVRPTECGEHASAGLAADGIRVGLSEKPEYFRGKLSANNAALGQDLLFQYGCVAGLQKLIAPVK